MENLLSLNNHSNDTEQQYKQFSIFLTEAFLFMNQYGWIPNSYVAEFFTQNHWQNLPKTWTQCFEDMSLNDISHNLLQHSQGRTYNKVWPLSLLAFTATAHALALNRKQMTSYKDEETKLMSNVFRKHVKPKKRHELSILPEAIHQVCRSTNTKCIVDVGSGLGHLARYLAYKYGYDVIAVEMTSQSGPVAEKYDKQMESELQRICKEHNGGVLGSVTHVNKKIEVDITTEEFCKLIGSSGGDDKCILIGLHTCGDLASTMLKVFQSTSLIAALVSVSCCYFKMTLKDDDDDDDVADVTELLGQIGIDQDKRNHLYSTFSSSSLSTLIKDESGLLAKYGKEFCMEKPTLETPENSFGFPMSRFARAIPCQPLKYKSFETACHFVDDYSEKLLNNSPNLKLHCYRAMMEILLRKIDPKLILAAVRCKKIKGAGLMTFSEYAEKVMNRVDIIYDPDLLNLIDVDELLLQWENVCVYHSLGLLLGPVVESVALVDKCMYLLECGFNVSLVPLFDPKISPRNFVVISTRKEDSISQE